MMTLTMVEMAAPTTFEISRSMPVACQPVARVLWSGSMGSTYQGYYPADRLPRSRPEGHPGAGESVFSRPLTCPTCAGALELHQTPGQSPDHLEADCARCHAHAHLEVGAKGRITMLEWNGKTVEG